MQGRTIAVVQARMGSSRLPGKVLLPVLARPMLSLQLERLSRASTLAGVVVATSSLAADDPVHAVCEKEGISCFRGSESDVLDRFVGAARHASADTVVRITGDCPLIDPAIVDLCVNRYFASGADYLSNVLVRTYPRGMDTEVVSAALLARVNAEPRESYEREHVTPVFYRNPQRFKLASVERAEDASRYRLTVDTADDFRLIETIFRELYPKDRQFGLDDILELLRRRPELASLNEHVTQKPLTPSA